MMETNARRLSRMKTALVTGHYATFGAMGAAISIAHDGFGLYNLTWAGGVAAMMGTFFLVPVAHMIPFLEIQKITPRLPPGLDRGSVRRMVDALVAATRNGIDARGRLALLSDMQKAEQVISHIGEQSAWLKAAQNPKDLTPYLTQHLMVRGEYLRGWGDQLAGFAETVNGVDATKLTNNIAWTWPLIASIARDFGIDTSGFEAPSRPVPGQLHGEPTPIPQIAAPTVSLANEWLSGTRDGVSELTAIAADTAAGRDLDELQRSWRAARMSAVDGDAVQRVDETFTTGLADLSRTLSDAITERSASDERDLRIQGRYIESKHGGTAGDLVAS